MPQLQLHYEGVAYQSYDSEDNEASGCWVMADDSFDDIFDEACRFSYKRGWDDAIEAAASWMKNTIFTHQRFLDEIRALTPPESE